MHVFQVEFGIYLLLSNQLILQQQQQCLNTCLTFPLLIYLHTDTCSFMGHGFRYKVIGLHFMQLCAKYYKFVYTQAFSAWMESLGTIRAKHINSRIHKVLKQMFHFTAASWSCIYLLEVGDLRKAIIMWYIPQIPLHTIKTLLTIISSVS